MRKHLTEEHRKKISLPQKGIIRPNHFKKGHNFGFKKGQIPWNKKYVPINCGNCEKIFQPRVKSNKYCSIRCARAKQVMPIGYKRPNMTGENNPAKRPEVRKKISENKAKAKNWITKTEGYRSFTQKRRELRKKQNGGSFTIREWETLKAQYNWTCPCCFKSEPEIKLTIDHIIPISKGGSDNIENIQPLCLKCNIIKSTKVVKY